MYGVGYRGSSEKWQIHVQWSHFLDVIGNLISMVFHFISLVSLSYNHCYVHQWMCYRGSSEMSQIHTHWWHFSRLLVTVDFDDSFNTKVWSVDHIINVIYINGVCYRGSSEMSQIHTHWWHFLTAGCYCWFWWCFITKVWSVQHIIIVMWSVL